MTQLQQPFYADGTTQPNPSTVTANEIADALYFIDPSDRDTWVRMGMAIKSDQGEQGFSLWDTWSQQVDSYQVRDAKDVWKSLSASGTTTIGSLFYEAKQNGWQRNNPSYQELTPEELAERKRQAEERTAKAQAEELRQHEAAANQAVEILAMANADPNQHPYAIKKAVDFGPLVKRGAWLQRGWVDALLIPLYGADGKIWTLEAINSDGEKDFLKGGRKRGGFHPLGNIKGANRVFIGEGLATVATVHAVMGEPAVVAMDAGNLELVVLLIRKLAPDVEITLLADNDIKLDGTNPGIKAATRAALAIAGSIAIPEMDGKKCDFWDLWHERGEEAVRDAIERAIPPKNGFATATVAIPATAKSNHWPEPQPITAKITPEPYPLDALPDTIRAAVEEVAGFVKAPIPLIASSALAALSLAIQAHADVKRAEKLHGPTGLFLLTIADSGERKSTCDGFFTKAIRDYEQAEAEAARPVLNDYQADIEAWMAKCAGVKEKIRQLAKGQKPTADMESALRELQHDKPEPPRIPRLLYADATPEALAYGLAKRWPSGGVVSAEAGIVFGSHGMGKDSVMRNLGLLNQLWDGTSLTIDRRTTESFSVHGARLTVALQVQEPTLREFFAKSGALARGTGFLARFLIAWPESTQGQRPFTEAPANWPALAAFHQRIATILNQPVPIDSGGILTPVMLSLTPEAKAAWVEYHDVIEADLSSGGELYDVRDVASKSADNAARLAALFQLFEHGMGGAIGLDCFERASRIVAWHLSESRRFFGELALPAEIADAARLDNWLIKYCQKGQAYSVGKNYIRQHGPIRDGARLDAAIHELAELDRLRIGKDGKRVLLVINPAILMGASS